MDTWHCMKYPLKGEPDKGNRTSRILEIKLASLITDCVFIYFTITEIILVSVLVKNFLSFLLDNKEWSWDLNRVLLFLFIV